MRWLILTLLLSACDFSQVDTSDAGDAAASRPCDNKSDCNACQVCAAQQACAVLISACQQSSPCMGLDGCMKGCGADLNCKQQCYAGNVDGVKLYEAMMNCLLCDQCLKDCTGYRTCS